MLSGNVGANSNSNPNPQLLLATKRNLQTWLHYNHTVIQAVRPVTGDL